MNFNSLSRDRYMSLPFFMLGVLVYFPTLIVTWLAAEDVLAGSTLSTSILFAAFSLTEILSKFCSPFLVSRIPFSYSVILQSLLTVGSLLMIVLVHSVQLRIVGVTTLGIPCGLGMIMCLRMTAYYDNADKLSATFTFGINVSAFFASIVYTGLTTWARFAPRTVVACCIPLALSTLLFYALLDKTPLANHCTNTSTRYQDIEYTSLQEPSNPEYNRVWNKLMHDIVVLHRVFPLAAYYFIANCSHQTSIVAVLSTLTFSTAPFAPRDHYQYYRLISDAGIQVGGIQVILASCLSKKSLELFQIKRVWIFVILIVICLLFCLSASWYRFLPNVYIVVAVVFVQGISYGFVLVQGIGLGANTFKTPEDKGTAMGFMEIGLSTGRLAAGLLGLFVERYLRDHCTNRLFLGKYCMARIPSSHGWYKLTH